MTLKKFVFYGIFLLLTFNYLKNVKAQDTFGTVCDDVTVTCAPTATPGDSPTPTIPPETPPPTDPPPPTPAALPRAGTTDKILIIFAVSASLIAGGLLSRSLLRPA